MSKKLSLNLILFIIFVGIIIGFFVNILLFPVKFFWINLLIIFSLLGLIVVVFFFLIQNDLKRGILFIAFFLPLEWIGTCKIILFPGQFFSLKISMFFVFLTFFVFTVDYLYKMYKKREKKIKVSLLWILIIYIYVCILSVLNALNIKRSIIMLSWLGYYIFGVYFLTINIVQDRKTLEKTMKILFISASIVSLYGLFQFIGDILCLPLSITGLKLGYSKAVWGFPRIHATHGEPLYFGNYLLLVLPVCFISYINKIYFFKKFWHRMILILLSMVFILTFSRGVWLGMLSGIVYTFFLLMGRFKKYISIKKIIIILILLVFVMSVFFTIFPQTGGFNFIYKRFFDFELLSRRESMGKAWKMFIENPLLGVGIGNYSDNIDTQIINNEGCERLVPNNTSLEILSETGIIGFSVFLLFILIYIRKIIKSIKKSHNDYNKIFLISFLISFIGMLIQQQTFSGLTQIHFWFLIGLSITTVKIVRQERI